MNRNNTLAKSIMASADPVKVQRIETRMLVAQMLHDYLGLRNISQQSLASRMGKQPSEVSKWLSGDHNFTIDTLSDIGYYLEMDFFSRKDTSLFRCVEEIELSRTGVRSGKFESIRVSQYIFAGNNYIANKKLERCPA